MISNGLTGMQEHVEQLTVLLDESKAHSEECSICSVIDFVLFL